MKFLHPAFEETYQQLTLLLIRETDIARRQVILDVLRGIELDKTGVSLDVNAIRPHHVPSGDSLRVKSPLN